MRPDLRDASYLWDIVDAARTAIEATRGIDSVDYERNAVLRLAAERCIEIIGEAANRVSEELRDAHPEIPWQKMVSQRNVLAHEYRDVRHEKIWSVLRDHLPQLLAQLEPLLPPPPPPE
jgi:uncharacterized protein with HEPN domain